MNLLKMAHFPRIDLADRFQVLYGRIEIGSTGTILGIYKLLAALKVLRQWTDDVFRPWFDGILLPSISQEEKQ